MTSYWFTDLAGEFQVMEQSDGEAESAELDDAPVAFSASSCPGWHRDGETDLLLLPSRHAFDGLGRYRLCDVQSVDGRFDRCPRTCLKRLSAHLEAKGWQLRVGVELEFHLFDAVTLKTSFYCSEFKIQGRDGSMRAGPPARMTSAEGRYRRRPGDPFEACRRSCVKALAELGIGVHSHSHETGFCQNEIALAPQPLCRVGDALQIAKQTLREQAVAHGFTLTFAPKPLAHDYGNGMHLNLSIWQGDSNLFYEHPHVASSCAHRFGHGVLKHLRALNALLNPTTNSYARLLSTFDYRMMPSITERNRRAVVRVPPFVAAGGARLEFRFPDACANPYTGIAALLLAGLDGIERKEAGDALGAPEAASRYPANRLSHSLFEAAEALEQDCGFLRRHEVFSADLVRTVIDHAFARHLSQARYPSPAEMHTLF